MVLAKTLNNRRSHAYYNTPAHCDGYNKNNSGIMHYWCYQKMMMLPGQKE
jgi:hypothetical protein